MHRIYGQGDHNHRSVRLFLGSSLSLSSDGRILAVGGPKDNSGVGATWMFEFDGSTYRQFNNKLVGSDTSGYSQGKDVGTASIPFVGHNIQNHSSVMLFAGSYVSLSWDGRILAVGGVKSQSQVLPLWLFISNGATYQQIKPLAPCPCQQGKYKRTRVFGYIKVEKSCFILHSGWSVSLSSDGTFLAVGGPGDNNGLGATWIFVYDGSSTYQQLGEKLVGNDPSGSSWQGKKAHASPVKWEK